MDMSMGRSERKLPGLWRKHHSLPYLERRTVSLPQDRFGRRFSYLRLSLTSFCNFRCVYCLPNGYQSCGNKSVLSSEEIRRLVEAFAELGITKVRLTGGEPTVRRDIVEIVGCVCSSPGVQKVGMTTNGYRLTHIVEDLRRAGLSSLNVSVDSLHREKFQAITGQDRLPDILEGIEKALALGFNPIKVNVVLLKNLNDEEPDEFLEWIRETPITIRFIELMRTPSNASLFEKHHISPDFLKGKIEKEGWRPRMRLASDGPAEEYTHPDYKGAIGVISPYSNKFCTTCNRLRITSRGDLRLCLFGESDFSLRPLLQENSQKGLLQKTICSLLVRKPVSHFLYEGLYGNTPSLSAVGG